MNPGYDGIQAIENTEAWRPVQADVDVNSILLPQADGPVDGLNLFLVYLHQILGIGPKPVVHRQPDEVESPITNPAEVAFEEHPIVLVGEIFHPVRIGGEI